MSLGLRSLLSPRLVDRERRRDMSQPQHPLLVWAAAGRSRPKVVRPKSRKRSELPPAFARRSSDENRAFDEAYALHVRRILPLAAKRRRAPSLQYCSDEAL